jgi:hypothetical protein
MTKLDDEERFGSSLASLLDRRDRLEYAEGASFGASRLFHGVTAYLLKHLSEHTHVLEVDPAAGLFTRILLSRPTIRVTALEPAFAFAQRLRGIETTAAGRLRVIKGLTEDLPPLSGNARYGAAFVTFTSRRGRGLLSLVNELLPLVEGDIYLLMADDGSLDWAYLLRAAGMSGMNARIQYFAEVDEDGQLKCAVVLTIRATDRSRGNDDDVAGIRLIPADAWDLRTRVVAVPWPAPRGAATRLMRYFLSGGDRGLLIKTDENGITRLYGNLRTAANRLARGEVTVRRTEEGVQLLLIPKVEEGAGRRRVTVRDTGSGGVWRGHSGRL